MADKIQIHPLFMALLAIMCYLSQVEGRKEQCADCVQPTKTFNFAAITRSAVTVGGSALSAVVGKKALRAGCIRVATGAFSVAKGVIASKTWRSAAVYTGTRVSNYLQSSWNHYLAGAMVAYDAYQVVTWLMDE
ncbi:uncharacterized protein LOC134219647 [Armigeres subalbatus]|uniref:uncharacterized protein LOC134219647 n=1 Tax=Armigeres subalbatus TaxID=124917 RepID=UPI002ED4C1A1